MKLLLSLYDHSGNQSLPYKRNGWLVKQIDIKLGTDILTFDAKQYIEDVSNILELTGDKIEKIGIICATPCTDYAISGAKHFARKDSDGTTDFSQKLVAKNKEIIDYCKSTGLLQFHQTENPMSRIHKLNPWMGEVKFKFNPCDFVSYVENVYDVRRKLENFIGTDMRKLPKDALKYMFDVGAYNKMTWLWGEFNNPKKDKVKLDPPYKDNPGFVLYGGKSEATKEKRSVTPMGFAWAFYYANN